MLNLSKRLSNIYFIGGSPCSGKSTTAQMAAKKYGFFYFEIDKQLETYIKKGALANKPACLNSISLSSNECWMRDPKLQSDEELNIYREIFEYALSDLSALEAPEGIITEGAAYLPELMAQLDIGVDHYLSLVPTKEFQYTFYSKRPWIQFFLEGCTDKKQAFDNWMARDAIFAQAIHTSALNLGYPSLINDGSLSIETIFEQLSQHMHWE